MLVIGGGNSATEEGIFLTKFSPKVTLITNAPELTAGAVLRQKVTEMPQMHVITETTVEEFKGNGALSSVVLKNVKTGERQVLRMKGVFVFIGLQPNTDMVKGVVDLDETGFMVTDRGLQTSVKGVFAAGDVRAGSTHQAASAVGEGATAALSIRDYLKETLERGRKRLEASCIARLKPFVFTSTGRRNPQALLSSPSSLDEPGPSSVCALRNSLTPFPIAPKTSGSFPAPKTTKTITSKMISSGPPTLNGMTAPPKPRDHFHCVPLTPPILPVSLRKVTKGLWRVLPKAVS